jgi:hypothetical protein
MRRFDRIVTKIAAEKMGIDPLSLKVAGFFRDNPNPSDSSFHSWAKDEGLEPDVAEAAAYRLATLFTMFLFAGRAAEKKFSETDADPEELSMGIAVEMEHTSCGIIAKRIALDHLAEISDYYTRLKAMEEEAGIKD